MYKSQLFIKYCAGRFRTNLLTIKAYDFILPFIRGKKYHSIMVLTTKSNIIINFIILLYNVNVVIPNIYRHELDALVVDFWWGSQGEVGKIHWVSKDVLGLPKDLGGLGFRNFTEFNDALLAKQCWRLLSDPDSLWARVIKAHHFPYCFFWEAQKGG